MVLARPERCWATDNCTVLKHIRNINQLLSSLVG
jgi:hypothetical protein